MRSPWNHEERLVGNSPSMRDLSARVSRVAESNLPVLLHGETGTGKELLARAIHLRSPRRHAPFISENCAALAQSMLSDELFGHGAGSFTGATGARAGLFERAHGGTLFLDEVGDMSLAMQAKLLRVLQDGELRRVGEDKARRVDVRVVAATHKDLHQLVAEGSFRDDLLFRLAVLEVEVPPLRERIEDVPLLATRILHDLARERNAQPLVLSEEAVEALLQHSWPGNVRELQNAIRVAALFSSGGVLDARTLPRRATVRRGDAVDTELSYDQLRERLSSRERNYVQQILAETAGNKAEAARRLGITRYALYRTLRRLDIDLDEADAGVRGLRTAAAVN
ncbi:MAG: sigma-54-dependent Fis family transcriptional regulator [Planctomycetes bacterium]|nr:sigma-54-dependent Fis family transcriptional regulator [Planctomycetota bacterium]